MLRDRSNVVFCRLIGAGLIGLDIMSSRVGHVIADFDNLIKLININVSTHGRLTRVIITVK